MPSAAQRHGAGAEQALGLQSDGRGWARNVVNRLCIDPSGRVSEPCTRDNVKESYLTPTEHPVTVRLTGAVPVGATCAWSFDDGEGPARTSTQDCAEPINLRVRYGAPTKVQHRCQQRRRRRAARHRRDRSARHLHRRPRRSRSPPAKAIRTARWRWPTTASASAPISAACRAQYYRPSRAGYKGGRACEAPETLADLAAPQRAMAQPGLPPLAVFLPDPHRAGAGGALSASRRHLSAAGLHRRHHRRRPVRLAARPRMRDHQVRREMPGQRQRPARRTARGAGCRHEAAARPHARSGAAVDRRQRHQFLRHGRRRHRRQRHRARAVQALRRDRRPRRFPRRADARPAAGLCQIARGAEAAVGRRPVARGLHLLRQSGADARRRPAPAAPPASTSIPRSTPIPRGSPASPASCRTNSCRS